jgi:hypothetical protein
MRAFIVRPFGTRNGIDFERVETELIDPVLKEQEIEGRTTGEIVRAGNIRTDMFERLLVADLVIADISIQNANVYYELGIRHALRDRTTILIRAKADDVPFDLKTDRYLEYDPEQPETAIPQLREAIVLSTGERRSDSPVYLLLPKLAPHDPSTFYVIPQGFAEAVRLATTNRDRPMLALLSEEIEHLDWVMTGRRLIGRAQFDLSAWSDAKETWEWIRANRPEDFEANLKLGTIFQRLGELGPSSIALGRVLDHDSVGHDVRAEALALIGSNRKTQWTDQWREAQPSDRASVALSSALLYDAATAYGDGFSEDQNHYYSGINALSLTTLVVKLAEADQDTWSSRFETMDDAELQLQRMDKRRKLLAAALQCSLQAARYRQRVEGVHDDPWLDMTFADYRLLTSDKPAFVKTAYDTARARLAEHHFSTASAARQLRMYTQLGVLTDNARAGLQALGAPEEDVAAQPTRSRVLVFSGHRVDAPGRTTPRFPSDREDQARTMIREAIEQERALAGESLMRGIAGGASGGDILFHEICADRDIPTDLLLAMPEDPFAAASVADGGPDWVERFRRLCDRVPPRILQSSETLPEWLAERHDYTVWQRSNLWILHTGLSMDNADVTLIVLWNGEGGDGPGGTQDMVDIARRRGVKVVVLDAKRLLDP